MRERDGYRQQLEEAQRAAPEAAANGKRGAEEAAPEGAAKKPKSGLTPDIAERLTACSNELSKGRKKRAVSATGGCFVVQCCVAGHSWCGMVCAVCGARQWGVAWAVLAVFGALICTPVADREGSRAVTDILADQQGWHGCWWAAGLACRHLVLTAVWCLGQPELDRQPCPHVSGVLCWEL
jgi:hypothetical protein